jgi:recombination protein RecT
MSNELVPTIGNYLNGGNIRKFLESMLRDRTGSFITSLVSLQNLNKNLQGCEPNSLMMCGLKAVGLGLPLDPNLGQAYPVPYNDRKRGIKEATFQMGYKGYVQLAMRTGRYRKIVVTDIREGEAVIIDPITETYEFKPILDEIERAKKRIIGYYGMFELLDGFRKEIYWTAEKVIAHAKRYSKSYEDGPWKTNHEDMCKKTLIRQLLPKWGPMSVELHEAVKSDMAVLKVDENTGEELAPEYPDNPQNDTIEADYTVTSKAQDDLQEDVFDRIKRETEGGK